VVYRKRAGNAKQISRVHAVARDFAMSFTAATITFLARLAFGTFAALILLRREQIGGSFSRFMAGVVAVAATIILLLVLGQERDAQAPPGIEPRLLTIAVCVATGCYIFAAGARRPALESGALWLAGGLSGALLYEVTATSLGAVGSTALGQLASFGSALVLGFVGGALILGHWYLVVPGLALGHLARLNRASLVALYARTALLAVTLAIFHDRLSRPEASSFRAAYDLMGLITRIVVGLVVPIVLGHLTAATIRLKATQPATGILYASTVLVLMGELMALVVSDSLHIPA
jgi:hypothetical protein